jgi:hypothetical protein
VQGTNIAWNKAPKRTKTLTQVENLLALMGQRPSIPALKRRGFTDALINAELEARNKSANSRLPLGVSAICVLLALSPQPSFERGKILRTP